MKKSELKAVIQEVMLNESLLNSYHYKPLNNSVRKRIEGLINISDRQKFIESVRSILKDPEFETFDELDIINYLVSYILAWAEKG